MILYISLKRTHPADQWFTLWRSNQCGYTLFKEDAGLYVMPYPNEESVLSIELDKIEHLFIEVNYYGQDKIVLPNTPETRKVLGIEKNELKEKHPYNFSRV